MKKFTCECGNASVVEDALIVFTAQEWDNTMTQFVEEWPCQRPIPPRTVLHCSQCGRIMIWDRHNRDIPVVYQLDANSIRKTPSKRSRYKRRNFVKDFNDFNKRTGVLLGNKSMKTDSFHRDVNKFVSFVPPKWQKLATTVIYKYLLREDDVITVFSELPDSVKDKINIFIDKALLEDSIWECGWDITNIEQNYWGHHAKHNNGIDERGKGLPEWYEPMLEHMKALTPRYGRVFHGEKFNNFIDDFED